MQTIQLEQSKKRCEQAYTTSQLLVDHAPTLSPKEGCRLFSLLQCDVRLCWLLLPLALLLVPPLTIVTAAGAAVAFIEVADVSKIGCSQASHCAIQHL